ncbi:MAG: peptidase T [Cardiobacteriaceae bacterium]|nr:peptidase T [Cardiobacteriaceae bacterium]
MNRESPMRQQLCDRFFRYVAVSSQSDAANGIVPSSEGQRTLSLLLADELRALGLVDVKTNAQAITTARLPATSGHEAAPTIGFIAHLDTVDVNLSPEIHPHIVRGYAGGDICLNAERDIWLRVAEHPEIERYIGDDIIVTDGTSVLGADDKSAIASIMTALDSMQREGIAHGEVRIAFVPDEEIGLRGAKVLDLADFPVDYAYTLDCCGIGELCYETFNAAHAHLHIDGVPAHPMSAKGVLVNPNLVAVDVANLLDRLQTPENTADREGYIWLNGMSGNQSYATLDFSIRDHDRGGFAAKKAYLQQVVDVVQARYPRAKLALTISDTYANIRDAVTDANRHAIDHIFTAMKNLGIEPQPFAMRGGTDGSELSARGVLTPNIFTGAHNFHSPCEFLPLRSFAKACEMVIELCRLATRH